MLSKWGIFQRLIILICLLLIPVILIYSYSNQNIQRSLQREIESTSLNHVKFFLEQFESLIDYFENASIVFAQDPDITQFQYHHLYSDSFEQLVSVDKVSTKLLFQSTVNEPGSYFAVISPQSEKKVFSYNSSVHTMSYLSTEDDIKQQWYFKEDTIGIDKNTLLKWNVLIPSYAYNDLEKTKLIVQVGISEERIRDLLDQFKQNGKGDPLLVFDDASLITNRTVNEDIAYPILNNLQKSFYNEAGNIVIKIARKDYLVNYVKVHQLNAYLINFVPLQELFVPVKRGQKLFYLTVMLLILLGIWQVGLLYKNVKIPIKELLTGVQSFEKGDYSVRIKARKGSEFYYLFNGFNRMANRIQELIERIYLEKIRAKDATLKQLQSQINPHFLYNCLYFIESMVQQDKKKAASEMVMNLADYYRSTIQMDDSLVELREEIKIVENYLKIQRLRMNRISYKILIPENILNLKVPRLIIQPLVENSIIHGIEKKLTGGSIFIYAEKECNEYRIIIEDEGEGLSEQDIILLEASLSNHDENNDRIGLHNVHERLKLTYNSQSGLKFERSKSGGLKVIIYIFT
ncbi:MAG: sensor histidine kinase [Anaerobacillus sp.]|uniref:sensor histidine kinase n=1 Tax=Anaerobacillus sp. TaxID=1872506 RepID=UPI00391D173C